MTLDTFLKDIIETLIKKNTSNASISDIMNRISKIFYEAGLFEVQYTPLLLFSVDLVSDDGKSTTKCMVGRDICDIESECREEYPMFYPANIKEINLDNNTIIVL